MFEWQTLDGTCLLGLSQIIEKAIVGVIFFLFELFQAICDTAD